ncbi:prepilin-type N-terminal cleavage/methylation domain-containing protein [Amycolatopsis sp. NPDC026612]|uniref:PulJ/GspJ family protein n=1 Tax=Amycolatopsis sp. NPDC026612 TaxID=3155466 RepID=UPI0033FCDE03
MLSRRSDAGFTLVELLIVIVILGVVAAPIANAVIVSIKNTDATSARLAVSHDAQQSSAFFAQDVAAVGLRDYSGQVANGQVPYSPSIQLGAAYDSGGQVCGTAATPVSVVRLLSDDWDTSTPSATRRTALVAYYLAGTELHRLRCLGSATPVADSVVAHNVAPGTPAVTCSSACADAAVPLWVKLTFTAVARNADPYPITLFGQRRQT